MGKASNDRVLGGVSAGGGCVASILIAHLFNFNNIYSLFDMFVRISTAMFFSILIWFSIKGALRLLRSRSGEAR